MESQYQDTLSIPRPRVAILDDDPGMRTLMRRILDKEFQPRAYPSGRDLKRALREEHFDIILLDLGLASEEGLDVLRYIRLGRIVPVIIVSGRGNAEVIEAGLNLGADDYVTKPFVPAVLCARIRSVLRRCADDTKNQTPVSDTEEVPLLDNLFLPSHRLLISGGGQQHLLTERESHILKILCTKSPGPATRDEIMRSVTGTGWDPSARSLDVHICRIRSKMASAAGNRIAIDSIRGIGYRLRRVFDTSLACADPAGLDGPNPDS
jgi:two-component system OmpR family response regulator